MKNASRGFTLLELMVVLAVAAVIMSIGVPAFNDFRRNSRITGIANDFLGAMQSARSEAIKRQGVVAVCPSDNPATANPTCTDGPFRGWVAFLDADNDCLRDAGEEVLRVGHRIDTGPVSKQVTPVSNGECASFAANGFLQTIAGRDTATRTLFCDSRGNTAQAGTALSAARGLEVSRTGRARVNRDIVLLDAWTVDCP